MYNDTTIAIVMCLVIRRVYNKEGAAQGQPAASQARRLRRRETHTIRETHNKEKRESDTMHHITSCIIHTHVYHYYYYYW